MKEEGRCRLIEFHTVFEIYVKTPYVYLLLITKERNAHHAHLRFTHVGFIDTLDHEGNRE